MNKNWTEFSEIGFEEEMKNKRKKREERGEGSCRGLIQTGGGLSKDCWFREVASTF
jgi:hypothetical protein